MLERLNKPIWTAAATAILYAALGLARLAAHDFDPSAFVLAGDRHVDAAQAPAGLSVMENSGGYDGQFYYRLALDPFDYAPVAHGIRLDIPSYRTQRVVYPILAWALAFGQPEAVIWTLILVNFIGIAAIGYAAALLAQRFNRHALTGVLIAAYPGFMMTFARDLTEIVAMAFLLWAVLAAFAQRNATAALLFSLAILSRETTLLLAGAFFLETVRRRIQGGKMASCIYAAIPLAVWVAWNGFQRWRWGALPAQDHIQTLDWPFKGLVDFVTNYWPFDNPNHVWWALQILIALAFIAVSGRAAFRAETPFPIRAAWSLYALLAAIFAFGVWLEDWGFIRVLCEAYLVGAIALFAAPNTRLLLAFAPWMLLAAAHFVLRTDWI